jgi:O-antigen/teichoic acid export membrane protein
MEIKKLINNSNSKYIIITFLVSVFGLIKSFISLKILDSEELGLTVLAQTFISTIGLTQFGVVTGGYRLFSYKKISVLNKINAAVLFFFILLTAILLILGVLIAYFINTDISLSLIVFFILIGILSLYSNWIICQLLGTKNIIVVNKVQLASAIFSLIITASAIWLGFSAIVLGLFLQPAVVIFLAYFQIPEIIPRVSFISFKKYIKKIISLGFVPYLTSAFGLFNSQLGKWLIAFTLGTVFLGKTILPLLFVMILSVFPGAVANLYFPKIIEKFEINKYKDLNLLIKKQFLILVVYYSLVLLLTFLMADVLIRLLLPKHLDGIGLIYAIIPSLIFNHLSGPAINLFNAAKKFNYILIGGLISLVSYVFLLLSYLFFFNPKLVFFFVIESISAFVFFVYNIFNYIKLNKLLSYD